MKIRTIARGLVLALAVSPALAKPCNDVFGCVVRAEFCTVDAPEKCHVERLLPEHGVGLCTMVMMQAAVVWIVGDRAAGKPAHPGFRVKSAACVTPDEGDI